MVLAAALLATATLAMAVPNEDNQPTSAPADYDAAVVAAVDDLGGRGPGPRIAQIGGTVYVAGAFTGMRPTRTGTVTTRGYLAASTS